MKLWVVKNDSRLTSYTSDDKECMDKLAVNVPILISHIRVRSPRFHRLYFKFISLVYKNLPESITEFEDPETGEIRDRYPTADSFRKRMEMLAGHYEITISLEGVEELNPKSIKYEKLDDIEFRDLYVGVKNVIGKRILPYVETFVEEIERFY